MVSPIELLRTRMQASSGSGIHKITCGLQDLIREKGISSLWRGLAPTLWRDLPFSGKYELHYNSQPAIYWFLYEETQKTTYARAIQNDFARAFAAGCVSGMVCFTIFTDTLDICSADASL